MDRLAGDYAPPGTRLLLLSMLLATIPVGYQLVVLPLYLARVGIEPAVIGGFFTASGAMTALLVAFSGLLADRFGRRLFLIVGTLLPIASYLIFAATTNIALLVIASFLGGVGLANGAAGALTIVSFDPMLADRTTDDTRTRVFALSQALWSLALAAGSLCAGAPELLAHSFGFDVLGAYRVPYLVMAALTLAAGLVLLPLRDDAALHRARAEAGWFPTRSRGPMAVYSLGVGFLGFGLGLAVQLLPLWYGLRFGVTEADLGPWYAAGQIVSMASVAIIPWCERRLGGPNTVLAVLTGSALCLAGIVAAPTFVAAATLHVTRSFLTNMSWPFQQSMLMTATAPEERGTAAGFGFAVWAAANATGPIAAGILIGAGAFALPLLIGAVTYVCGGLAFGVGFRRFLTRHAVLATVVTDAAP